MQKRFPKTAKYDPRWVKENSMGPNPLWLLEALSQNMTLSPGMKVLDMGCGKAITSIFLAKEFGVQVWANDLWISATENWQRIRDAGVEDRVFPIQAEAHHLPYAEAFFDALISIDAYHYFGTDETYLAYYFQKLVKTGGQIGIVVPGLVREFERGVPQSLHQQWSPDMYTFHSSDWWRHHWEKTGLVEVEVAESVRNSREIWEQSDCDHALLAADEDQWLTFVQMTARRTAKA